METYVQDFLRYFITSYFGGVTCLICGLLIIISTVKNTEKNVKSVFQPYASGIISGICFVFIGIFSLLMKILGKW